MRCKLVDSLIKKPSFSIVLWACLDRAVSPIGQRAISYHTLYGSLHTGRALYSKRHEINVRLAVGGSLCGLGHDGLMKLLGALNLPSVVQEHKYTETQEFILPFVEKAQNDSMAAAVEAAVTYAGGSRDLTVSENGAWLTRGFSSFHDIAALCSATGKPKVLDAS
ncbi:unnamed protein product [Rotaria magnacalcarata]|uniref:Mutator-like transposase domain-containing protein n=1 Tax=Rotaria magnacalcarata TaxID=392030 RepID=A0A816NI69_9BILA|nr:unnamed protein product [Rotaria magnacalcarata]CAF4211249.1 unnamed protein product [Rotaria magnacalcarata]CAF4258139.1 unnamed protein product [Rotaria magnacalcarata]